MVGCRTQATRTERDPAWEVTIMKLPRAAVWAAAIFLAVAFVLVGISKVRGPSAMRWGERFVHWGYPAGAERIVGVLETLAGVGVLNAEVATSCRGNAGRAHDRRALHASRSRRIPSPDPAARPGRIGVSGLLRAVVRG